MTKAQMTPQEYRRAIYARDPMKQKLRNQRYRERHEQEIREAAMGWKAANYARYMFNAAKCRAKKKGREFTISIEDVVVPTHCPVLGIPLFAKKDGTTGPGPNSPTLDRIDNKLGYIKGNVIVISYRANGLKSDATIDEVRRVLAYLAANEF